MNAYEVLTKMGKKSALDEKRFYDLVSAFRKGYLEGKYYQERLTAHRHPVELKQELLRQLYKRLPKSKIGQKCGA